MEAVRLRVDNCIRWIKDTLTPLPSHFPSFLFLCPFWFWPKILPYATVGILNYQESYPKQFLFLLWSGSVSTEDVKSFFSKQGESLYSLHPKRNQTLTCLHGVNIGLYYTSRKLSWRQTGYCWLRYYGKVPCLKSFSCILKKKTPTKINF